MFKLNKHKPHKSAGRFDFNFSKFQAVQVPKGWDKLFVSIISVKTGKTATKSGKASVRNGNCQWMDTLSQSLFILQDGTSKELEECLFKFVVAMGSAKSGFLGEATLDLSSYVSSKVSMPISIPLEKCKNGTILQFNVLCLTPKEKLRDEPCEETNAFMEDMDADYNDTESNSDVSESPFSRSIGSSSRNHLDNTCHPEEHFSRETSFSASGSRNSFESAENFFLRESFSPQNNISEFMTKKIVRRDSTTSLNCSFSVDASPRSSHSSLKSKVSHRGNHLRNQKDDSARIPHSVPSSPLRTISSKDLIEAAVVTTEELRAEARMWEQNARKMMHDLEILRKEFSDQSKKQANLEMELSASHTECNGLRFELEQLKVTLEESMKNQEESENLKFRAQDMKSIHKELEDEIKFLKESNANFDVQLKKTQESNLELVSILQELEDTVDKQKMEIDYLKKLKLKYEDIKKHSDDHENSGTVNPSEEDLAKKVRKNSWDSDLEGSTVEHPIRDSDTGFEPVNSKKLELQLQQLLESQKNLEHNIQFLEKTLDKNHELELKQSLRPQTQLDCEETWRCKLAAKEEEISILEEKLAKVINGQGTKKSHFEDGIDKKLNKELEALNAKVLVLERDCNELTKENMELLFKLKESKKDLLTCNASFNSSYECSSNARSATSEPEIINLGSQMCKLKDNLNRKEAAFNDLKIQYIDLENKCTDLELQLQNFKDKASHLNSELRNCHSKAEKQEIEIAALQQQLECFQEMKTENNDHFALPSTNLEKCESHDTSELPTIVSELRLQFQLYLAKIKKQQHIEHINSSDNPEVLERKDVITQRKLAEALLNDFIQLNKLFEGHDLLQCSEEEIIAEIPIAYDAQNNLEGDLKEALCLPCERPKDFHMGLEVQVTNLGKELSAKISEMEQIRADHLLKEEEIETLKHCQKELETQIFNLQNEKILLEKEMENMHRESSITVDSLDNFQNQMTVLNSHIDSQVSANKVLERKSSELECVKHDLELHLSKLEEENVQLSERISGLEAQLRYLTDERESNRLEMQNLESHVIDLHNEITRLGNEKEAQKVDMKQKLQNMQKRWLEAQEECEYLKKATLKLQGTAESLIEECSFLQKLNAELRKQNIDLHGHSSALEARLRESYKDFSDISKKVEALEAKFSSMLQEIASKNQILNSELDAVLHEHREFKEKLVLEEDLLNEMYLKKADEVEQLQGEVAHLTKQISATHDERERTALKAVLEVSSLQAGKVKLEATLKEVYGKIKLYENRLDTLQRESEIKVRRLMSELATSQQEKEILMAEHENLHRLFEDVKSNEENLKSTTYGLEMKLKSLEHERLQLAEEISGLNFQLQKTAQLQDEVLALKTSLNEAKFENDRLEASFQLLRGDYEDLKAERISFIQKISSMQKATSELEDCKRDKVALEEKIFRLEGDLTVGEALFAQEARLKNELGRIKMANGQFQQKIKYLEEEKEECLKRSQALEEELKQIKVEGYPSNFNTRYFPCPQSGALSTSIHRELKLKEGEKKTVHCREIQMDPSVKIDPSQVSTSQDNLSTEQVYDKQHSNFGSSELGGIDPMSKIQFLESELAEALEANELCKTQLKRWLSGRGNGHVETPKKLTGEDNAAREERNELKNSSVEAELRDLRERYLNMSLKYAEVEAQREHLVMELKAVSYRRR